MGADAADERRQQGTVEGGVAVAMARPTTATSMSAAQFQSWKRHKDAIASARKAEAAQKRAEDVAAGAVQMNGRELFLHEPWVFDNSRY